MKFHPNGRSSIRYYRIEISSSGGQLWTPPGFSAPLLGGASYTSYVNGQTLPGAWNIELDLPIIGQATPQGAAFVRIWGVSIDEIAQASNLNGKNIAIYGGMQKGLPLAKPQQSGLLVKGVILQAFGNAIDVDRTLDIYIMPMTATSSDPGNVGTLETPRNIAWSWKANTSFATAIQNCLQTAFPGRTINVNVSSKIVRPNDETGIYSTLEQFAQMLLSTSLNIVKDSNYPGVSIIAQNDEIDIFDGTTTSSSSSSSATQIAFEDMIGQPTWIDAPDIQVKFVMRADLKIGKQITLPPTLTTNTAAAASYLVNQKASFQGGFTIISMRHVGNFRQPSADAWVSVIEAYPNTLASSGAEIAGAGA